jgi:transcriptional regulator with XRE-family HTH domain
MRIAHGMSPAEVTNHITLPATRLAQIENGEVAVDPDELAALLELYGVTDEVRIDALHELARVTRARIWWDAYGEQLPDSYRELISAEADAYRITHFHPTVLPGLLQTEEYAAAVTRTTTLKQTPPEVAAARVEARLRRQREVLDGPYHGRLVALVDETTLYRRFGSAGTMRGQLDHLAALDGRSGVTLVVVPRGAEPHPGLLGAFMLIEYNDRNLEDVLCFEWAMGNTVVRGSPDLAARYRRLCDDLLGGGLTGDLAHEVIRFARAEWST